MRRWVYLLCRKLPNRPQYLTVYGKRLIDRYCPVGRGVLTGSVVTADDIPQGDYRHLFPRYQADNLAQNRKLVQEIEKLADAKACTTAQISLGWLLALSEREDMPTIIPIPGSGAY